MTIDPKRLAESISIEAAQICDEFVTQLADKLASGDLPALNRGFVFSFGGHDYQFMLTLKDIGETQPIAPAKPIEPPKEPQLPAEFKSTPNPQFGGADITRAHENDAGWEAIDEMLKDPEFAKYHNDLHRP